MSKRIKRPDIKFKESKVPGGFARYTNTILMTLAVPFVLLGMVYLVVFFLLNSSYGPAITGSILSNLLRGDFRIGAMSTDPFLQTLTLHKVTLAEAGKKDHVIYAPKVEAKIPTTELFELSNDTLLIGRIKAYNPDVYLDFSKGELNILKVVLPYFSKPEPPDPEPGNFTVFLSNLNVEKGEVHLVFDGFRIDLSDVYVDKYSIRTSPELIMDSPRSYELGQPGVRVGHGALNFNPAMFSFAMASRGDADEGLIMSGGSGTAGNTGYAYQQSARFISEILRNDPEMLKKVGNAPDIRGNYIIPLRKTLVDGFHWKGNRFDIPEMVTEVGRDGMIHLTNGMMNVGPTQKDIDDAAQQYQHKPSGLLPEESILWGANVDVRLSVDDPVITYFFGPILHGETQLRLMASMAGDLARVSGDLSLDVMDFETFDVDVNRVSLRAHMDGQHLGVEGLEADTMLGGVIATGYYEIMDGNFDFDLYAGKAPKDGTYTYIDPTYADRMNEGMTPLDFLPDGAIKRFGGLMTGHLKAQSEDGTISVSMPEKLTYKLDEPIAGIREIEITPANHNGKSIFSFKDNIIKSDAGLSIDLGNDYIRVDPGLRYNLDSLGDLRANAVVHVEHPSVYAKLAGIQDLSAGPLDAHFAYQKCGHESCGEFRVKTSDVSYMGIDVPKVELALNLDQSQLSTEKIQIQTEFATISANIQADHFTPNSLQNPTQLPFHAELNLQDVDLENIHLEAVENLNLDLKGKGEGTATIDGPIDNVVATLTYTMNDVEAKGVPVDRMRIVARYEDKQVYVPMLNIWFTDAKLDKATADKLEEEYQAHLATLNLGENDVPPRRPYVRERGGAAYRTADLSINTLTYDPQKNFVAFNTVLQPTSPNEFKVFRDLDLPVDGKLSFDISGNADLDLIGSSFNSKNLRDFQATWLEGDIKLQDLKFGDMNLGNTEIKLSRSQQFSLIKGNILDLLELSGFVRTSPHFSVSASLNFPDLDVLQALEQLNIDISDIKAMTDLKYANLSGSIGFCMTNLNDMRISVVIDDVDMLLFGNELSLAQPAFIRADLAKQSVTLRQVEFKYRDSVLKLSGTADAKGNIDADINGEIDAAIARSFIPSVKESTGLLGVSLSARGNLFHQGNLRLRNVDISGYLGVRDPIQILTSMMDSPLELSQGFIVVQKNDPKCIHGVTCLYTPDDQPFMLGLNNEWVSLSLFADARGSVNVALDGTINAAISQLFVKDVSSASGKIDLNASVKGDLIDQNGINMDLNQLDFNASIGVAEPIAIELRSLSDEITVDDGTIQVTKGNTCPSKTECIVIPKSRPFKGSLMGGNYLIFGEIVRENIIPKSGNLNITANNVSFRMKDELSLSISPDIQITAKDLADFDTVTVAGDVEIAEARYKKNFDDGSSNFIRDQIVSLFIDSRRRVETYSPSFLRKMPQVGKIHLDIGATAENTISADVKIAGASVDLEVGTQLRIGGTIKDFYPTGIVSINNGIFKLRDNEFEFQNGAQIAFNGSLDGKIDITATTEINTDSDAFSAVTGSTDLDKRKRISSNNNNSSDLYAITLTVGGTVFRPVWSFESSPYLTDTNVYALILTGRTIEDFSGNDVAMESLLSPLFSSQLDTFIHADQFKFVFSEGAAQFVYVKQINKGLRIAAGVSIRGSDGNEQALSAEYYFNDNLFVDLTGQNTSDEEGRAPTFKLGARLHWHYLIE